MMAVRRPCRIGARFAFVLAAALECNIAEAELTPRQFGMNEPVEAVLAARRAAEDERQRINSAGDWCGAHEIEHEMFAEQERAYFAANASKQRPVASRCRGRVKPNANVEAIDVSAEAAMNGAMRALEKCVAAAGLHMIELALEVDSTTGGVRAAHVRNSSTEQLDRCVVSALADACFEPGSTATYYRVGSWLPNENAGRVAQAERDYAWLAAPQRLAPVSSACPTQAERPWPDPLADEELTDAFREAIPHLQGCMKHAGILTEDLELAINVHGPTGRVVGAAAVVHPKRPELDACIAGVLKAMCFYPFAPPPKFYPYFATRTRVPRVQDPPPYRFPAIASRCTTRPVPSNRDYPGVIDMETATAAAVPTILQCLKQHGYAGNRRTFIDVDIDPATGGFKAASVHADYDSQRKPDLDACVAAALQDACVVPFRPRKREKLFRKMFLIDVAMPYWNSGFGR